MGCFMDYKPDLEERLFRENIQLAKIEKRVLAHVIDDFLLTILLFFTIIEGISSADSPENMIILINSFVLEFTLMKFFYHVIFTGIYGASLGKIVMKIRIVNMHDFGDPTWRDAFYRGGVRIASETVFWLGFLWAIFDPNKQGWHDKSAKTIVVDVKK
jgi:uncharacterized RDD family membrane protein YckC